MLLLQAENLTLVGSVSELTVHLIEIIGGIISLVACYFRLNSKVDLMKNDFANFKENTKENHSKLENNMKDSYSKVENKMAELEQNLKDSHRDLSDKIDKMPQNIANIFTTILNK